VNSEKKQKGVLFLWNTMYIFRCIKSFHCMGAIKAWGQVTSWEPKETKSQWQLYNRLAVYLLPLHFCHGLSHNNKLLLIISDVPCQLTKENFDPHHAKLNLLSGSGERRDGQKLSVTTFMTVAWSALD